MTTCLGNCCSPGCRLWCLWWCLFVLSFFPRGVLDEILNLIESVSEDFPSYSCLLLSAWCNSDLCLLIRNVVICWEKVYLLLVWFLAHLSLYARRWDCIIARHPSSVHRLSVVRQHFQISCPLKPLGQLKPNFMWRFNRTQELNFVRGSGAHGQDGRHVHIWYKAFKIFFSRTCGLIAMKFGREHLRCKPIIDYSNYDQGRI